VGLHRLLNPRTIAMIGGRPAEMAIEQCDFLGFAGEIWPVHSSREMMAGRPVYHCVADLPEPPDAAFVAVNRHETVAVVHELATLGAGGAVCYAAGFAEAGPEGAALQQRLVDHQMPVIGPNCYGMINARLGAALWPDVQGCARIPDGRRGAALISQSGNIALNLTMNTRGLDFTHVISLGNQAGVRIEDCIATLAADPAVAAIGVHAESIVDSVAFAAAARIAHDTRTPIVMLKTGLSDSAAHIAASHTAALSKPADVYGALFDRYGIVTVGSIDALITTLAFFTTIGPVPGNRLVSLSCSGGEASLVADRAAGHDLLLEPFSAAQADKIRATLSDLVAITNPLDYHTFIWGNESALTECFTAVLNGPTDAAMLVLDWPTTGDARSWVPALRAITAAAGATDKPTIVAASMAENMPRSVREGLRQDGIATAGSIDDALVAVAAAAAAGRRLAAPFPSMHSVAPGDTRATRVLAEANAKSLLANAGVVIPRSHRGPIDALAAVDLRYPLVAKVSGVTHKTDVGGVIVGIGDSLALQAALDRLTALGGRRIIKKKIVDVVAELLVAIRREPPIGDVLVIGAGGALVELLDDTATALLPVNGTTVAAMLAKLRIGRILDGHRGAPSADHTAIADVVARLSALMAQRPDIVEVEINPLLATPSAAVAVDALITLGEEIP